MPGQNGLAMSPMMALLSPDQQQNMMQLQQRQAIGQAMLQQGMQPVDTSNAQVGGLAYRVSPLQGVAKLLQTYLGNKMAMDSLGQQGQLMGQVYGNAFGHDQQAPVAQSAPPVAASADSSGLTGPSAGMGGMQGTPSPQALGATLQQNGVATPTQTVSTPGTFSLPGYTAAQSKQLYMMAPEEYAKARMGFVAPTDATRMALAAHMDPVAANAAAQFKANYVPPNQGTPGTIARDPRTNQPMYYSPNVPANGQPVFDAGGRLAGVGELPGANALIGGQKAAETGGEGSQLPFTGGVDAQGNPLPVMNRTQAATGNAPLPMRNNNPGAVSPNGQVAKYPDMQTGLAAMDKNLAGYASDPKVKTLGDVITKWVGSPTNAPAYIKDVTTRLGIPEGQKIDLTNPAQRLALSTAIMLHENGPGAVFASGGQQGASAQGNGAIYAAPPMGAQANIEANVKGQVDTMQKSYQNLQTVRSGAPAALQDLGNMQNLASGKSSAIVGPGMASMAGLVSANAAEYEKSRDNLVTNLGSQLGINSDAAREMVYGSIPSYGAPKQAIANGLQTLQGQVQTRLLKAGYLTDAYTAGDAKAYNQKENQFDQNMTPAIANIVTQPAGPQRSAALAAAAKDPQVRARLEWAAQSGILK